jgi:hypothetical protein
MRAPIQHIHGAHGCHRSLADGFRADLATSKASIAKTIGTIRTPATRLPVRDEATGSQAASRFAAIVSGGYTEERHIGLPVSSAAISS